MVLLVRTDHTPPLPGRQALRLDGLRPIGRILADAAACKAGASEVPPYAPDDP